MGKNGWRRNLKNKTAEQITGFYFVPSITAFHLIIPDFDDRRCYVE